MATASYGRPGGCGEEVADSELGAQVLRTALQHNGFKYLLDIRGLPSQMPRPYRDTIGGCPSAEITARVDQLHASMRMLAFMRWNEDKAASAEAASVQL